MMRVSSRFALSFVCVIAAGCGGGDDGGGGASYEGDLYLVATSFTSGDQTQTYFVTTDRFDTTTTIDPTNGPALLGGVVPIVHGGSVYAPDSNAPVIVRFQPDASGMLVRRGELSFAGVGMTEIMSWHVYVVSDTKGYVFDPAGLRIVVWNPSTMTLAGTEIDLADTARDGWSANLVFEHSGPQRRGDQLLIPLGWTDQDGNSRYATGALIVNTTNDSVAAVTEDTRCGESYATIVSPAGDVYFFPPDWSATPHFFADNHQPTCILRIRAGATSFDSAALDLSALGSGSAGAGAIPDGASGFYFTTVDPALWPDVDNNGGAVWKLWHHDFTSGSSSQVAGMPVWAGHPYYVNVDGVAYIPFWEETQDGYKTTMYTAPSSGIPTPVFSFNANWYGAARIQ